MKVLLLLIAVVALVASTQGKPRGPPRGPPSRRARLPAASAGSPTTPARWEAIVAAQRLGQERCEGCKKGTRPQHALAGVSAGGASLRIAGGGNAADGQLPWMAVITMDSSAMCGGSVISETFILTSAQCASGYAQYMVGMGSVNRYYSSSTYKYAFTYKSIPHEDYEEDRMRNDIGLLQLLYPVSFSDAIRPVKLPSAGDVATDFAGQTALISGWGTFNPDYISYWLKFTEQPVMDNTRCARFFPDYVTGSSVCGDGEGGVGICDSDAGGPLVVQGDDGVWKQIGVASLESDLGCFAGYPSVYTRVTEYLQWLESNTGLQLSGSG